MAISEFLKTDLFPLSIPESVGESLPRAKVSLNLIKVIYYAIFRQLSSAKSELCRPLRGLWYIFAAPFPRADARGYFSVAPCGGCTMIVSDLLPGIPS
jgi:hypothetical protein